MSFHSYSGSENLIIGDDNDIFIQSIGHSTFSSPLSTNQTFKLHNILHVPTVAKNLIIISKFSYDNNVFFEFHQTYCCVKDHVQGMVLLQGQLHNGLYVFYLNFYEKSTEHSSLSHTSSSVTYQYLNHASINLHHHL